MCPGQIARYGDRFRVFEIGFSLYERAWTMREMVNLLIDFYENADFVHNLLNMIADYNIAQIRKALRIELGVNCFNPFQPEVMDVFALAERFRGRLSFHGGLSTQKTLPYGTVEDVRKETLKLIENFSILSRKFELRQPLNF